MPSEVYKEKSINELKLLLNNKYEEITLWFDFDMFCQINRLAVLAYLDSVRFEGLVTVNSIKQDFFYCSQNEIIEDQIKLNSLDNFYSLYMNVLINKDFEKVDSSSYIHIFKKLPYLKAGIKLYRNYKGSNNEMGISK